MSNLTQEQMDYIDGDDEGAYDFDSQNDYIEANEDDFNTFCSIRCRSEGYY